MKILQSYPYFYPAWGYGGVTRVVYEISKYLVNRGHEVTVYTTDALNENSRIKSTSCPQDINGIRTYYFKNLSNYLAHKHILAIPIGIVFKTKRELKKFDVIHLHGGRTFQNIIIYHYAKRYGIPYVFQAHGSLPRIMEKQKLKRLYDWVWGYKILRNASKVIALTNTEAEQYKKMGVEGNKIEIVPNGIDISEYANLPEKGKFKRKYSIKYNEKIVLYVGRLHKSKGIDLIFDAISEIIKEVSDVKLILVGPDNGYQLELENRMHALQIADKVLFTGFVDNNEKLEAFVDADVFVTPSFLGFPVTFLEACTCGTPIIITNKGDELDWIQDKVGFVVGYDKIQLRNSIIKIIKNQTLKERFGKEGKKLMKEKFCWKEIIINFEIIYNKL